MSTSRWLLVAAIASGNAGCKSVECGEGTIERDGACVPADDTVNAASCGEFTQLVGGVCVPMFPPTVCDPATTAADLDESTRVTTCIGTGGGGCSAPLACPQPVAGKQTVCGRLYDFGNGAELAAPGATGARCTSVTADGPCSIGIRAYDAFAFGTNPACAQSGTCVLTTGEIYVDDCGRYRVPDITQPAQPFIALGFDDAMNALAGPAGTTNTTGIGTQARADVVVRDLEAFVAPKALTDQWVATGGPAIDGGLYAMIFRGAKTGFAAQGGITVTKAGSPQPAQDHYFVPAQATRTDIDPLATATGANGTALFTGAAVGDGPVYSGTGLPAECRYTSHAGATIPFVLFVQVARPIDAPTQTCPL